MGLVVVGVGPGVPAGDVEAGAPGERGDLSGQRPGAEPFGQGGSLPQPPGHRAAVFPLVQRRCGRVQQGSRPAVRLAELLPG